MTVWQWAIAIVVGLVSGGMMWSAWIPKCFSHTDIRAVSDDGNPGSFNVFRHCGKAVGALCLALDVAKGLVPVLLASALLDARDPLFALVAAAPVLGHVLGLCYGFRGGKGIATAFGVCFGLFPVAWIPFVSLAALYILFSVGLKIRSHKARSITVFVLFALIAGTLCALFDTVPIGVSCLVTALAVVCKHLSMKTLPEAAPAKDTGVETPAEEAGECKG